MLHNTLVLLELFGFAKLIIQCKRIYCYNSCRIGWYFVWLFQLTALVYVTQTFPHDQHFMWEIFICFHCIMLVLELLLCSFWIYAFIYFLKLIYNELIRHERLLAYQPLACHFDVRQEKKFYWQSNVKHRRHHRGLHLQSEKPLWSFYFEDVIRSGESDSVTKQEHVLSKNKSELPTQ